MRYIASTILLITLLLNDCIIANCQIVDFNNYHALRSSGTIPDAIIKTLMLNNRESITGQVISDDKKEATAKTRFMLSNDYHVLNLLRSGDMLFGDTISNYVNKVAAVILKDSLKLKEKLNFIVVKNYNYNAYSNNNGFIFINMGLISKLKSEAELAYILAHEIAHFVLNHPIEHHMETLQVFDSRGRFRYKNNISKIDRLGERKREKEFEADSLALVMIKNSPYSNAVAISTLQNLHFATVPFDNIAFDKGFFNAGSLVVPTCYFLDSCAGFSEIKDTYDENYSHPNILKRINKVKNALLESDMDNGVLFHHSESDFNYIREVARFETLYLKVRDKRFGIALYDAYLLSRQYPNNRFIELSVAKSLYGLTKFRNEDKFFYVAEPYEKVEGESQQLHYFLRQLNRKQLNVIAFNYVNNLKKKYPAESVLDKLESDLINEMVIRNKINIENASSIDIAQRDNTLTGLSLKEKQKEYDNFYMAAFNPEMVNETFFKNKYDNALELAKTGTPKYTYAQELEMDKIRHDLIKSNGLKKSFTNLIILDPMIFLNMTDIEKGYDLYSVTKIQFDRIISDIVNEQKIDLKLISTMNISVSKSINDYNQLCIYQEILKEHLSEKPDSFYPVGLEYYDNNPAEDAILCLIGVVKNDNKSNDKYFLKYIDLTNGEILYSDERKFAGMDNTSVKKSIANDFKLLTK